MPGMMRAARVLLTVTAGGLAAQSLPAQQFDFQRDCAKWIEQHGFAADYIKKKTGKRQRGLVEHWVGNVEPKDVQPGDVVVTLRRNEERRMRAAYVEEVQRHADGSAAAVIVSEWNEGKYVDERCAVTDHFGRLSEPRPIIVDAIVKVWRPSLPILRNRVD